MAEETRNEQGQFGRLDQVKDQATYNRVRAAQIAGKDPEEDDDEPAEEATGKEESQKEYNDKRKHPGGGLQKRINKMHKAQKEAEREAQELRQRVARYESGEAKPGEASAQPELSEEERKVWQARETRHHAAIEKARTEDPDFEDIQKASGKIVINNGMRLHMLKMDNTWEIVKYFAKHPEIAKEWLYLPFGEVTEKITKLSGKLEAEAAREDLADKIAKRIPPPTPIKPLNGGGHSGPRPLRELSQKEYKAARERGVTKW